MASSCRKFQPNIFNKSKCQSCFRPKEHHSAEALESSKASRKISKCGYLFISPDLDFSNPVHKTKRWQRRFFVLFDDGELTYSLDDNVNTIPQGIVDMNKCTDVYGAENITSHDLSIGIVIPNHTHYIKGTTRDEINRWHDVLVMYPRSIRTKHRRSPTYPHSNGTAKQPVNKTYSCPAPSVTNGIDESYPQEEAEESPPPIPPRQRFHSSYQPSRPWSEEDKENQQDIFDISPRKVVEYEQEHVKDIESELTRTKSEHSLASSGSARSTPEPNPLSFRSVRSLKNKGLNRDLRKSRSLQDLTDINMEEENMGNNLMKYRSRSRDDINTVGETEKPRRSEQWTDVTRPRADSSSKEDSDSGKPKTFYDSLMHPDPPKTKPKTKSHSAYLKLASIPKAKHLESYTPTEQPKRRKSMPERSLMDLGWRRESVPESHTPLDDSRTRHSSQDASREVSSRSFSMDISPRDTSSRASNTSMKDTGKETAKEVARPVTRDASYSSYLSGRTSAAYISSSSPRPYISAAERARKDSESSNDSLTRTPSRYDSRRLSNGPSSSSSSRSTTPSGILKTSPASASMHKDYDNRGPLRNETDELKMARHGTGDTRTRYVNGQLSTMGSKSRAEEANLEDLMFMKKGWLLMLGPSGKDWVKHWFVLSGNALKYFRDSRAEEANFMNGVIDLSTCYEVAEVPEAKNYGFKLKTTGGDYTLSAMTTGIRGNWMEAIRKCADANDGNSTLDSAPSLTSVSVESWASKLHSLARRSEGNRKVGLVRRIDNDPDVEPKGRRYSDDDAEIVTRHRRRGSSEGSVSPPRRRTIGSEKEREAIGLAKTESDPENHRPVYHTHQSTDEEEEHPSAPESPNIGLQYLREIQDLERDIQGLTRRAQTEESSESVMNRITPRDEIREPALTRMETTPEENTQASQPSQPTKVKSPDMSEDEPIQPFHFRNSSDDIEHELDRRDGLHGRAKSPAPKAPSAKIKEKSRSKSPKPKARSKSPKKSRSKSKQQPKPSPKPADTDFLDEYKVEKPEPTEQEERKEILEPIPSVLSGNIGEASSSDERPVSSYVSSKGGEAMLVELLEAEVQESSEEYEADEEVIDSGNDGDQDDETGSPVESLKAKLEHTQSQLIQMHNDNSDLKAQLKSTQRDHKFSLDDMENEQHRYLSQIADIQDEMEHKTGYLHAKLAEQNNKSEMTKLQVHSLKNQLKEARDTIEEQQAQVHELKEKLEASTSELSSMEATLGKTLNDWKEEKRTMEKLAAEWREAETVLKEDCNKALDTLKQKEDECLSKDEAIDNLKDEIREREEKYEDMVNELHELRAVEQECHQKTNRLAHVEKVLGELRNQISVQLNELDEKTKKLDELEQKSSLDKRHLEGKVQEMERRLEKALKQSNISDSMNSNMMDILREKDETIAQLEERLIENDGKMDELMEEISVEVQTSTRYQEELNKALDENNQLKGQVDNLSKELEQLRNHLQTVQNENATYQEEIEKFENIFQMNDKAYTSLLEENTDLKGEVEQLKEKVDDQDAVIEGLKKGNTSSGKMVSDLKEKYESACKQLKQLQSKIQGTRVSSTDVKGVTKPVERSHVTQQAAPDMAAPDLSHIVQVPPPNQQDLLKEYTELKKRFEAASQEVRKLKRSMKEAQSRTDELKKNNEKLQQKIDTTEHGMQTKIAQAIQKVDVLSGELAKPEKGPHVGSPEKPKKAKVEYSKVTEELESQLNKLENKIKYAETFVKTQMNIKESKEGPDLGVTPSTPTKHGRKRKSSAGSRDSSENELSDLEAQIPDQEASHLLVKIRKLKKKLLTLESKLKDLTEKLHWFDNNDSHTKEMQLKVQQSHATFEDCQNRLSEVFQDIELIPEQDDKIHSVKDKLQGVLQCIQESDTQLNQPPSAVDYRLRKFAEKVALDAIVLGEVAFVMHGKEGGLQEKYESEIKTAKSKIQELQQDVHLQRRSFSVFANIFAEKMMKQEELTEALDAFIISLSNPETKTALAQAVFSTEIDESHYDREEGQSSKVWLKEQLTMLLNRVKQKPTYVERVELLEQELDRVKKKLESRDEDMYNCIESYKNQKLRELAVTLGHESAPISQSDDSKLAQSTEGTELSRDVINQEIIQAEMAILLHQCVQSQTRSPTTLELLLRQEVSSMVMELKQQYHSELESLQPSKEFSDIIALRAVMNGLLAYTASHMTERSHPLLVQKDSGVGLSPVRDTPESPLPSQQSESSQNLALQSAVRQSLAQKLHDSVDLALQPEDIDTHMEKLMSHVKDVDRDLLAHIHNIDDYAGVIASEAILQAQLKYVLSKMKEQYIHQVEEKLVEDNQIKLKELTDRYETELESAHTEYVQNYNTFKCEIEKLKHQLSDAEKKLKGKTENENEALELRVKIENIERKHKEAMEVVKERFEVRIEMIQKELEEVHGELSQTLQDRDAMQMEYEDRILQLQQEVENTDTAKTLQKEISAMKSRHQHEIEEMKQDMKMALKSVRDQESRQDTDLHSEVLKLKNQLEEEKIQHKLELAGLASSQKSDQDASLHEKLDELQQRMINMQSEYEQELRRQRQIQQDELSHCKESVVKLAIQGEKDEASTRNRCGKELEKLKDITEQSFSVMEKCHQKMMLEMKESHQREMEILRQEKDKSLEEETKATQSALDAMRKAHEGEVQREKTRLKDMIGKMFSSRDLEDLRQDYEDEVVALRKDMQMISEQYSLKCLENASLEDRLGAQDKMLKDSRRHLHDLMTRNEELSAKLSNEIEDLKAAISDDLTPTEQESKEVKELKLAVHVRDLEIEQLKEDVDVLREQLQEAEDAQDETADKYNEMYSDFHSQKAKYELEMAALKDKLEEFSRERQREDSGSGRASRTRSRRAARSPRSQSASPERSASPHGRESRRGNDGSTPNKKKASRSYELRRSRSTPGMPVSHLVEGDTGSRHSDWPRRSGGVSVAERMKKFQQ